jgi:hypothetical protein
VNGRKLTKRQSEEANALLNEVRTKLETMSGGDPQLLFYYRRRIFIRLMHDERGTPAYRTKLKQLKMSEQDGKCSICDGQLPEKEAELDRFIAWKGYNPENTQLIHHECHRRQQQERGFGLVKPG